MGSAISLLFVILSYYIDIMSLSFHIIASFGIILPLSQKYYREAILSFVAVSAIGFFIVNIAVLPFVMVGGSYTIFTVFWQNKKYNYYISLPIKVAYSCLVFFIFYSIISYISVDISQIWFLQKFSPFGVYVLINIIFVIMFLIYDKFLLYCYKYFVERLVSKIIK